MKLRRREFLFVATGAGALPTVSRIARAQTYPTKPVRIVVGFAAGGVTDLAARLISQWLSEQLGQQFVVENRTGAATNTATEAVVRSAPDGYTLLLVSSANASNATLYDKLSFNFLRDIAPVARIGATSLVMIVNPSFPAKTVPEFIAYAKANPGKITMASGGLGTPSPLAGELFKFMTGVNMIHVPYPGDAPAVVREVLDGHVQVFFPAVAAPTEHIRAGSLRALGVTTSMRSGVLPEVPTVAEAVPDYETTSWVGVGAPSGTPPAILERLNLAINAGLTEPKMKMRLAEIDITALPGSSAEFGKLMVQETEKWAKVIRAANIKVQ
jgi:tripartite-type tricarboxylate transporter receptor subunit TctC